MTVAIKDQPELRVGTVRHIGPYKDIGRAFERLGSVVAAAGHGRPPGSQMIAIYHDDPRTTAVDHLRSDAAMTFPGGAEVTAGLIERHIPAGRYASTIHVGPYEELGQAWAGFRQAVTDAGHREIAGTSYEVYVNDPARTPQTELRTELFIPVS